MLWFSPWRDRLPGRTEPLVTGVEPGSLAGMGRLASGSPPLGVPLFIDGQHEYDEAEYIAMGTRVPVADREAEHGRWAHGLCGCLADLRILIVVCSAPYVAAGQLFERVMPVGPLRRGACGPCSLITVVLGGLSLAATLASYVWCAPEWTDALHCERMHTSLGGALRCAGIDGAVAPPLRRRVDLVCAASSAASSAVFLALVLLVACARRRLRQRHAIRTSCQESCDGGCCESCDDVCASFWCLPCVQAQMLRHLGRTEGTEYSISSRIGIAGEHA